MTVTIRDKQGRWLGHIYDVHAVTQLMPDGCLFFEKKSGELCAGLTSNMIEHDFPSAESPVSMTDFFPEAV